MKTTKNKLNMTKTITLLTIIILFSSATLMTSCTPEKPKGKNIICLVDFSSSENRSERLNFYKSIIENNVLQKMSEYDKLLVFPIDDASITNTTDIFITDLSKNDFVPQMASPLEEEKIIQKNINNFKDSILIHFENNFKEAISSRTESSMGTDIFGALEVAKVNLKSGKEENIIILLSDMMNWSKTLKMEPQDKQFSSNTLDESLSKAPEINLSNTSVLVLTGKLKGIDGEHFNLVKDFWTSYFQISKADLIDYNSTSKTQLNDFMESR